MHLLEDFTTLLTIFFRLGKTILVPLTNSLYVPGKLSDPDHVIVDVGTGYYVQIVRLHQAHPSLTQLIFIFPNQTRAQAVKHYSTKVDYIRTNLETLEDTIQKKRENMNYLVSILQSRIQTETQGGPQN
jgi:prefoldin alpha subunit